MGFIVHFSDKIYEGNKGEREKFLQSLKDQREDVIVHYAGKVEMAMLLYTFTTGEVTVINAEDDDPNAFYTTARLALENVESRLRT